MKKPHIALDQWVEGDEPILYGAVTTGDIWQFSTGKSTNTQDIMLCRVPTDLAILMQILVGTLTQN
ncbi:MAG: hypothetical protein JHC73_12930 [Dolichospermum sp.]|nr:hypothetical protein [Dolichospermum sp.]